MPQDFFGEYDANRVSDLPKLQRDHKPPPSFSIRGVTTIVITAVRIKRSSKVLRKQGVRWDVRILSRAPIVGHDELYVLLCLQRPRSSEFLKCYEAGSGPRYHRRPQLARSPQFRSDAHGSLELS